jgi:NADH dehydrogenase FAD-containing subunit
MRERKTLTIVVAGGPTGVEVSGMFAEMRKKYSSKRISGIKYHRKQYIWLMVPMLFYQP